MDSINNTGMKDEIIRYWTKTGLIKDERLISAFKKIKRENFIHEHHLGEAYRDAPLPLGYNQTISQPTTIMVMTQALEIERGDKILEIGTGSGYQAAILAELTGPKGKIYTIEIVKELADFAEKNLTKAKIKNVTVIHSDGSKGYPEEAPYNKIIVTAGSPKMPDQLIEQLENNGILVVPIGPLYHQEMMKITKKGDDLETENLGDFVFVPLKGAYGWE